MFATHAALAYYVVQYSAGLQYSGVLSIFCIYFLAKCRKINAKNRKNATRATQRSALSTLRNPSPSILHKALSTETSYVLIGSTNLEILKLGQEGTIKVGGHEARPNVVLLRRPSLGTIIENL